MCKRTHSLLDPLSCIVENAGGASEGAVHNATYDKDTVSEMNQSYVRRLLEKLPQETPLARDYTARMWEWLDAIDVGPITLVGHSLGALMAAAATVMQPQRVRHLALLAPALGYGAAEPALREAKLRDRLANLHSLGPAGMAEKRGAAMLSPQASAEQVAFTKSVMAQIDPHGYTQAARMLAGGNLIQDLARIACPITVASGSQDSITPPQACLRAAAAARTGLIDLGPVGHACALEAADAVCALLAGAAA